MSWIGRRNGGVVLAACLALLCLAACGSGGGDGPPAVDRSTRGLGTSEVYAFVPGDGGRWILARFLFPPQGRFPGPPGTSMAPPVVQIATYLTPGQGFSYSPDPAPEGLLHVAFLWPGHTDVASGLSSDGVFDYGGASDLSALRHVLRFVTGQTLTADGLAVSDLGSDLGIDVIEDQTGVYAFSHPGIAATNTLALYGSELPGVKWYVGRENPTQDVTTAVELGHWDPAVPNAALNPFYDFFAHYDATDIDLGTAYAHVGWDPSGDGRPTIDDGLLHYVLGEHVPRMYGKRHYSVRLTQALLDTGALTLASWPGDLATPTETAANWPLRDTTGFYGGVGTEAPDLKVLLLFANDDHVQPLLDKPHIHQAWDGFVGEAGLSWVRLNPDRAYVEAVYGGAFPTAPDQDANLPPPSWSNVRWLGYPRSAPLSARRFPRAAMAEMADRTWFGDWSVNLTGVLP